MLKSIGSQVTPNLQIKAIEVCSLLIEKGVFDNDEGVG
jgi:hypothetical protein